MKFAAATIFILLLLTQVFSKWLIVIDYTINEDYIANNFCVNKTKPQLHCNGKCQLAKKIAAEEEQSNQQAPGAAFAKASFSEVLMNDVVWIEPVPTHLAHRIYSDYRVRMPISFSFPIFHPPLA